MAEILETQEQFPVKAGIQGLNGIACGDVANSFDAAGRAAAGYFFLSGQEKVTKKKAAPEPPKNTCASRLGRARAELAERKKPRPAQTPAREIPRPRLRCSAAATGPNVKNNAGNCMLG